MHAHADASFDFQQYVSTLSEAGSNTRPLALLDLDKFHANSVKMSARAAGTTIRVASKSLRVRGALEAALSTPGYSGVLAFTLPEALWLAETGIRDIVVAYPTADREALRQLLQSEAREHVTVMVDSTEHLELLRGIARSANIPTGARFRVCLDIDASYAPARHRTGTLAAKLRVGPARSPITTVEQAITIVHACERAGVNLVGIMMYEGQVAGVSDGARTPRGFAVRALQALSKRDIAQWRAEVVAAVRELVDLEFVNGGGTGSIESTTAEAAVTEVAAGSGFYGPELFQHYRSFRPAPALHLLFDVVRRPAPDTVTVLGGGWIASGPPGKDRLPVPVWPEGLRYAASEGPGEVQTPLTGPAAAGLSVGDPVFFRHAKAGEPLERLNSVLVYSNGEIIDEWPTYRGEGKAFL
ncbi:alanine racemase [Arthrobacter sp. 179]|uniref:alanine racemase n=1 Tax=Arthrobacter sp. 179 TaxID=3457734 RepID=UPI004034EBDE